MTRSDRGLRARKRETTSTRIQEAALTLFATRGFDDTTVDDIAAAAGVSRASVFRYFGSKDDIVFAREPELLDILLELMREDPAAGLDEVTRRYATVIDASGDDLRRWADVIVRTPKLLACYANVRVEWEEAVAAELASRRGGDGASLEDRVTAGTTIAALFIAYLDWVADGVGAFAEVLDRALAARR